MTDTICAVATAPGGAIGLVRVSGPRAIDITDSLFSPASGRHLAERPAGTVSFGRIVAPGGDEVDEVLVSLFRAPHSYTGEDATEISCHGSRYILDSVVRLLIAAGCRLARPGEYTQRAFLNGKMDLSQAEAVADLIAAESAAQHRLALNQMRGGVGNDIRSLRDRLLHMATLLELELDFSDHEDLEFADRKALCALADETASHIARLCDTFSQGNALKEGIPIAIVGETNVGKSTLLNALVREERAIVSDVHGTTRDVIEERAVIGGRQFRFIDTAGIRHTADTVERLGIERTFRELSRADIVIWVVDAELADRQFEELAPQIFPHLSRDKHLILLVNKADLLSTAAPPHSSAEDLAAGLAVRCPVPTIPLAMSAHRVDDIDRLRTAISSAAPQLPADNVLISNARHYEALTQALSAIRAVSAGLSTQVPTDLISEDLRSCIRHLSGIIGEIRSESVLQNVFSKFCIGK